VDFLDFCNFLSSLPAPLVPAAQKKGLDQTRGNSWRFKIPSEISQNEQPTFFFFGFFLNETQALGFHPSGHQDTLHSKSLH
jgi:hypothetical protein